METIKLKECRCPEITLKETSLEMFLLMSSLEERWVTWSLAWPGAWWLWFSCPIMPYKMVYCKSMWSNESNSFEKDDLNLPFDPPSPLRWGVYRSEKSRCILSLRPACMVAEGKNDTFVADRWHEELGTLSNTSWSRRVCWHLMKRSQDRFVVFWTIGWICKSSAFVLPTCAVWHVLQPRPADSACECPVWLR